MYVMTVRLCFVIILKANLYSFLRGPSHPTHQATRRRGALPKWAYCTETSEILAKLQLLGEEAVKNLGCIPYSSYFLLPHILNEKLYTRSIALGDTI